MIVDATLTFIDTAYICALVNSRDQHHPAAIAWQEWLAKRQRRLMTTEFVLAEIADSLAAIRFREVAGQAIRALRQSPLVEIVPVSASYFEDTMRLFHERRDKEWGFTDCASFVAMKEHALTHALTSDHHFVQAGFRALLLELPPE